MKRRVTNPPKYYHLIGLFVAILLGVVFLLWLNYQQKVEILTSSFKVIQGITEKSLQEQFIFQGIISVIFLNLLLLISMLFLRQRYLIQDQQEDELIDELTQLLRDFRLDVPKVNGLTFEIDEKLLTELRALDGYLALVQTRADFDKEETKGVVSDIATQLGSPVRTLETSLLKLKKASLTIEEREENIVKARDSMKSLEQLLESLSKLSDLEASAIQVKLAPAKLSTTLVGAIQRLAHKGAEKEIGIHLDLPPGLTGIQTLQDEGWLLEALMSVIDNSLKYSPAQSNIWVGLTRQPSFMIITIKDEGIGIDKEDHHRVFQRFYRGPKAQDYEESGTGVGLYLARDIIKKHHGMISVKPNYESTSKAFPGVVITILLPYLSEQGIDFT